MASTSNSKKTKSKSFDGVLDSLQNCGINGDDEDKHPWSREPEENMDVDDTDIESGELAKWDNNGSLDNDVDSSESDDDDFVYPMSEEPCGKCIVFDIAFSKEIKFDNNIFLASRKTSFFDVQRIAKLFKWLKFQVLIFHDATKYKFLKEMKKELLSTDNNNMQCLVVFIMTYGKDDGLYFSDGKIINIKEEIIELLSFNNCKAFADKPKLIFIQASRPPETTPVYTDQITEHNSNPSIKENFSADSDIFVYSSPNIEKWEWSVGGSTFIQILCYFFEKYAHSDYLYDLVLKINGRLARVIAQENAGTDDNKMAGIYNINTLRKKVKFSPDCPFKQNDVLGTV